MDTHWRIQPPVVEGGGHHIFKFVFFCMQRQLYSQYVEQRGGGGGGGAVGKKIFPYTLNLKVTLNLNVAFDTQRRRR